jgi:ribosome-associated toxin RatA of RatAB toxin-antitoxin module
MGTLRGERSAEIQAPIDEVYAVLVDVEDYPRWQPDVKSVEVFERDSQGRPVLAGITQDAKVRTLGVRVRYTHHAPREISWRLDGKGDVKAMNGAWRLEDLGDGRTRATYSLEVDPGMALSLLLRGPVAQKVTDHVLDGTLDALRRRFGG